VFDRFTDEAKQAMQIARDSALGHHSEFLDDVHVLIGCCRAKGSLAAEVLLGCGQDPSEVAMRAEARAGSLPQKAGVRDGLPFTDRTQKVLELAMEEASKWKHMALGTHHFLLGLLQLESPLGEVLRKSGLARAEVRRVALQVDRSRAPTDVARDDSASAPRDDAANEDNAAMLRLAAEICVGQRETELAIKLLELAARMKPRS
jgi:ATP-dependent Clp protease ATP-binding subunit ClpA